MAKFIPQKKKVSFVDKILEGSSGPGKSVPKKESSLKSSSPESSQISSNKKKSFFACFSFLKWLDPFTYVDLFVIPRVKKFSNSSVLEFCVNAFFALLFAAVIYFVLGLLFGSSSPLVIIYSGSMEPAFFRGDVMALSGVSQNIFLEKSVSINREIGALMTREYLSSEYDSSGRLLAVLINGQRISYKKTGPVIVYPAYNPLVSGVNGKPIIHRVIARINALDGNFLLTKGDNDSSKNCFDTAHGVASYCNPTFDQDLKDNRILSLYAVPISEVEGVGFLIIPKIGCVKLWLFDDLFSLMTLGSLPADFKGFC